MKKRPNPIKPFKTLEEEAKFWETHDLADLFKNPSLSLSKVSPLSEKKQSTLTVRLQKAVRQKLEEVARLKGLSASALTRMWVIEKIQQTNK